MPAAIAYDDMVQDLDAQELTAFLQSLGYLDIFLGRGGITGGVVMNQDNRGSAFFDSGFEYFTGMNQAAGQAAYADGFDGYDTVLAVEENRYKVLPVQVAQPTLHHISHVSWSINEGLDLGWPLIQPAAQFQ